MYNPHEPSPYFQMSDMFTKSNFCKIFELTASQQSGHLLHSHDYTQIWLVTKGCCEHWVEGKKHEMVQGEAFLLPPKVEHKTILTDESSILCCEFSMDYFLCRKELHDTALDFSFMLLFQAKLSNVQPKFSFSSDGQQRMERLMRSMLTEYTAQQVFFEDYLRVMILELLLVFAREYSLAPTHKESSLVYNKYRSMVEVAIRYIDEHCDEPITLEDVCRISMVSKTYFCYLFKLITKQTFVEYLMSVRVRKAMDFIEHTQHSITYIGQMVGFSDSAHFSRTFKKIAGVSARTYRTLKCKDLNTIAEERKALS